MAGHRHRWRRCSWRSRRRWRPATPSTNPEPWPINTPPGIPKQPKMLGGSEAVTPWCMRALARAVCQDPASSTGVVDETADKVLAAMEERRSSWQSGMSGPKRNATSGPPDVTAERASSWWTCSSRGTRPSVSLTSPGRRDRPNRRRCGAPGRSGLHGRRIRSVHLAADPRRRAAPRHRGGSHRRLAVDAGVELALLESAANGNALDAGQAALVRHVHLRGTAAARDRTGRRRKDHRHAHPARAWTEAPVRWSDWPRRPQQPQLRERPASAETLAKLTWSFHHGDLPDWADASAGRHW